MNRITQLDLVQATRKTKQLCRQLKTKKGDRMAVFTLEDALGGVEIIAFPEAYQRPSDGGGLKEVAS